MALSFEDMDAIEKFEQGLDDMHDKAFAVTGTVSPDYFTSLYGRGTDFAVDVNAYINKELADVDAIFDKIAQEDIQVQNTHSLAYLDTDEYQDFDRQLGERADSAAERRSITVLAASNFAANYPNILTEETLNNLYPEMDESDEIYSTLLASDNEVICNNYLTLDTHSDIAEAIDEYVDAKTHFDSVDAEYACEAYDLSNTLLADEYDNADYNVQHALSNLAPKWHNMQVFGNFYKNGIPAETVDAYDSSRVSQEIENIYKENGREGLYKIFDENVFYNMKPAVQLSVFEKAFDEGYAVNAAAIDYCVAQAANEYDAAIEYVANDRDYAKLKIEMQETSDALNSFLDKYPRTIDRASVDYLKRTLAKEGIDVGDTTGTTLRLLADEPPTSAKYEDLAADYDDAGIPF